MLVATYEPQSNGKWAQADLMAEAELQELPFWGLLGEEAQPGEEPWCLHTILAVSPAPANAVRGVWGLACMHLCVGPSGVQPGYDGKGKSTMALYAGGQGSWDMQKQ